MKNRLDYSFITTVAYTTYFILISYKCIKLIFYIIIKNPERSFEKIHKKFAGKYENLKKLILKLHEYRMSFFADVKYPKTFQILKI